MNNAIEALRAQGQSIWLDSISRGMIRSGELKRLMDESGVTGVTTNPAIFEKAINGTRDYEEGIRRIVAEEPRIAPQALFEQLSVEDVRTAADVLRPVYDRTAGGDGFVSIEVSPHLAHDTRASVAEARRLWDAVARPNLMVKIPATAEGIPAIEVLLAQGVNVNVTLMFSMADYDAVAGAFLRGAAAARDPASIASVASVFVSRVDTAVDRALEQAGMPEALALRGKAAVANAKLIYRRFRQIFSGQAFDEFRRRGARVQRVLWGSTGTKNPAYPDVKYVEELIGPDTINTVPAATLKAFVDHGRVRGAAVEENVPEAESVLAGLRATGIDINAICSKLQADGVAAFAASLDKLLAALGRNQAATARP